MTCGRLYLQDTILERLPQDLQDMAAARGPCIQEAHAVVGPRHLARPRHVATADQPRIGEGVMGGATRAGGDDGGAAAGDAVNARRVDRVMVARKTMSRRCEILTPTLKRGASPPRLQAETEEVLAHHLDVRSSHGDVLCGDVHVAEAAFEAAARVD
jgi:hypothetical protein